VLAKLRNSADSGAVNSTTSPGLIKNSVDAARTLAAKRHKKRKKESWAFTLFSSPHPVRFAPLAPFCGQLSSSSELEMTYAQASALKLDATSRIYFTI
jgi:hypothetical protein